MFIHLDDFSGMGVLQERLLSQLLNWSDPSLNTCLPSLLLQVNAVANDFHSNQSFYWTPSECPSLSQQTLADGQEYSQSCKTASTDRQGRYDCPANPSCVFLTSRLTPNRLCPEMRVLLLSLSCLMRHRHAVAVKNKRIFKMRENQDPLS